MTRASRPTGLFFSARNRRAPWSRRTGRTGNRRTFRLFSGAASGPSGPWRGNGAGRPAKIALEHRVPRGRRGTGWRPSCPSSRSEE
ncbi:hypothetical protein ANANG_G00310540 [Anguilla anguilla]|uniref:Uncharacterized protein n=1 Tax=Anguilla anguilla TaxID=7936 RepID=A0A9D3LI02_ANGAN|nr:hypothetical protein ANANG_G00310540 [Anguilla anguilla]